MSDYNESTGRALDWDDEISQETEFGVLPEGEYEYKVKSFERAEYEGGDKISACKKAIVYLYIEAPNGDNTVVKEQLLLHSKMEWKLSEFFISIGQKKHGEPLKPRWNEVVGSTGRCKLEIHKWTSSNGNQLESNRVKKFLEPRVRNNSAPSDNGDSYKQVEFSGYTRGKF